MYVCHKIQYNLSLQEYIKITDSQALIYLFIISNILGFNKNNLNKNNIKIHS